MNRTAVLDERAVGAKVTPGVDTDNVTYQVIEGGPKGGLIQYHRSQLARNAGSFRTQME